MNLLKLIGIQVTSLILVITTLISNTKVIANTEVQSNPIKVVVIVNNFSDVYMRYSQQEY